MWPIWQEPLWRYPKLVICWVVNDQKTGRVHDYVSICCRDRFETLVNQLVWKILNKACLMSMLTQQWNFLDLPWYFHFWLNKNKRNKRSGKDKNALKKLLQFLVMYQTFTDMYQSFCCHVSKLCLPSIKALMHGRDQYLLHILDATGKNSDRKTNQKEVEISWSARKKRVNIVMNPLLIIHVY